MHSLSNLLKIMSFSMACIMSVSVMGFSIFKLSSDINDTQQIVWISLLSSIFSLWLPSPSTLLTFKVSPNMDRNTAIEIPPSNTLLNNKLNSRIIEEV